MKRTAPILILLALCGSLSVHDAAAQTKVLAIKGTFGVDADVTLDCERGVSPAGNNATRIEGGLSSASSRYSVFIPGGDRELTETIDFPARHGASLYGPGGLTGDLGDTHYTFGEGTYASPQVSRLIWKGADNGTMVKLPGENYELDGIMFQGCRVAGAGPEPTGGTYPNRAQIGVHIVTSNTAGARNTAKGRLGRLGFYQIEECIVVGRNLTGAGTESYTGEDDSHADGIYADEIRAIHPASGARAGAGSVVRIRNDQSVDNHFNAIYSSGDPAQVFYLERGGKTSVGSIHTTGDSIAVRVGRMTINSGALLVGQVTIDGGTAGKLLKSEAWASIQGTQKVCILNASIPESCTAVPQVDVGPGHFAICNCDYLRADSIKMVGLTTGGKTRVSHVHLSHCTFYDYIDNIVDSASTGPYVLSWDDCTISNIGNTMYNRPIADSTEETEIVGGGITRHSGFAP